MNIYNIAESGNCKRYIIYSLLCVEQAYVQQLESSRLKLTQIEQELQRAHSQVL